MMNRSIAISLLYFFKFILFISSKNSMIKSELRNSKDDFFEILSTIGLKCV